MDIEESERAKYIRENKIEENYSSIFLLPLYGYYYSFYPREFISTYLLDELKTKIVFCFNNSDSEELKEVVLKLQEDNNFFSIEYDNDNKEVVITLLLPKEFKIDFALFKIGRWSKLSTEFKELLLDFHGRQQGNGKQIMMMDCLFPNHQSLTFRAKSLGVGITDLPNSEVMSIPSLEDECYRKVNDYILYMKNKKCILQ